MVGLLNVQKPTVRQSIMKEGHDRKKDLHSTVAKIKIREEEIAVYKIFPKSHTLTGVLPPA